MNQFGAGEVEYLVPALLAIKMIRRSGCTLPIELWFPADEIVTGPLLQKIDSLGAHVCSFPVDAALGKARFLYFSFSFFMSSYLGGGITVPVDAPLDKARLSFWLFFSFFFSTSGEVSPISGTVIIVRPSALDCLLATARVDCLPLRQLSIA